MQNLAALGFLPFALLTSAGCVTVSVTGTRTAQPMAIGSGASAPVETTLASSSSCRFGETACEDQCTAGDAISCDNLGAMYEMGQGEPRDRERAHDLYASACLKGASGGCSNQRRLEALTAQEETETGTPLPPAALPSALEAREMLARSDPSTRDGGDDARARCDKGDRASCRGLPGIHLNGNIIMNGNVHLFGDVYVNDAQP